MINSFQAYQVHTTFIGYKSECFICSCISLCNIIKLAMLVNKYILRILSIRYDECTSFRHNNKCMIDLSMSTTIYFSKNMNRCCPSFYIYFIYNKLFLVSIFIISTTAWRILPKRKELFRPFDHVKDEKWPIYDRSKKDVLRIRF